MGIVVGRHVLRVVQGSMASSLRPPLPVLSVPPSVILFDLDGVLIPEDEATAAAFSQTCEMVHTTHESDLVDLAAAVRRTARLLWAQSPAAEYCQSVGISSSEGLCAQFTGCSPQISALRQWAPWYRQHTWELGLAEVGIADSGLASRLSDMFSAARKSLYRPYADVESMLNQLASEYQLGLITNGVADLQWSKLERAGLVDAFQPVVISSEVGIGKPDAGAFQAALGQLRCRPEQVLLVEDSPRNIEGARKLKMQTILLARTTGTNNRTGSISSLDQLVMMLQSP